MSDQTTLYDLLAVFWRAKIYVIIGMLLGFAVAFGLLAVVQPHYRAVMIVAPANPLNGPEVSSLLANNNLYALRYLVQRVGHNSAASDFTQFQSIYNGPSVAAALLEDENIIKGLLRDPFRGLLADNQEIRPETLAEYIEKRVRMTQVGATGMAELGYYHPERSFAIYFLHNLHLHSDRIIRDKTRNEAAQRIDYLRSMIEKSPNPEHKRALTTLLMEQERLRMLVSIDNYYAARVVEPASAPVRPQWPDPALVYGGFGLTGFLLALFLYGLVRSARPMGLADYPA